MLARAAFEKVQRNKPRNERSYSYASYRAFLITHPKLGNARKELKRIEYRRVRAAGK